MVAFIMKEVLTARTMTLLTFAIILWAFVGYEIGYMKLFIPLGYLIGIFGSICIVLKFYEWLGFK
jgi:hypothetical protein